MSAVELEPAVDLEESPIHAQLQAETERSSAAFSRAAAEVISSEVKLLGPVLLEHDRIALAVLLLEGTGMVVMPRVDVRRLAPDPAEVD